MVVSTRLQMQTLSLTLTLTLTLTLSLTARTQPVEGLRAGTGGMLLHLGGCSLGAQPLDFLHESLHGLLRLVPRGRLGREFGTELLALGGGRRGGGRRGVALALQLRVRACAAAAAAVAVG